MRSKIRPVLQIILSRAPGEAPRAVRGIMVRPARIRDPEHPPQSQPPETGACARAKALAGRDTSLRLKRSPKDERDGSRQVPWNGETGELTGRIRRRGAKKKREFSPARLPSY
jgi:hypothetical protein